MPGVKKYSPPLGMTKSPRQIESNGLRGSSPIMLLIPWPIIGSRLSRLSLLEMKQTGMQNFITYPGGFSDLVQGGKVGSFAHAKKWSNQYQKWNPKMTLTLLDKLESFANTGLITNEKKSSTMHRLSRFFLCFCHLRPKLDATSHDSTACQVYAWKGNFEVVSREGFPDVPSKRTTKRGS